MKNKKETKIQELERRIIDLENTIRFIPITTQNPDYPFLQQRRYWCSLCGGWVFQCPGHTISIW